VEPTKEGRNERRKNEEKNMVVAGAGLVRGVKQADEDSNVKTRNHE
jgi:hypothetical protein